MCGGAFEVYGGDVCGYILAAVVPVGDSGAVVLRSGRMFIGCIERFPKARRLTIHDE